MNSASLLPFLGEIFAKSSLLILGTIIAAAAGRRLSAAQQHAFWFTLFLVLLALPFTKWIAPRWSLPRPVTAAPVIVRNDMPVVISAASPRSVPPRARPATHEWPKPRDLVLPLWLAGALAIICYRLAGCWQMAQLKRRNAVDASVRTLALARVAGAELRLPGPCDIRIAEAARVPCTWGIWRPVVLLPLAAEEWSETHLLAALRHEFAHVGRHDYLVRWVSLLVCAIYWPNPLVWLAARRLHAAQERACDDLVLQAGTSATEYATLLMEAARASLHSSSGLRVAVAMARPSTLEGRILAVVDGTRNRRPVGRGTTLAGMCCALALIGASALAQVAPEKKAPADNPAAKAKDYILISAKFVEVRHDGFPLPDGLPNKTLVTSPDGGSTMGVLTEAQAKEVIRKLETDKSVDILASPVVLVADGRSADIQLGHEYDLPLGTQPPKKFVGTSVGVTPTAGPDGRTIDLDVVVQEAELKEEATILAGKPVFHDSSVRTAVSMFDRSTLILSLGASSRLGRELFVLLEAKQHGGAGLVAAVTPVVPSPVPQPAPSAIERARETIIPKIEFRDATVRECVEFLQARSDSQQSGVNVLLHLPATGETPKITLSLSNVSLLDALQYVAHLANLDFSVMQEALVIGAQEPPTISFVASPAYAKAQKLVLSKVEFREASAAEALDFLRAKAAQLDPQKVGVNLVLKPGPGTEAKVTLSLQNVSLAEALRCVATVAGMELLCEPNALVLEARGEANKIKAHY